MTPAVRTGLVAGLLLASTVLPAGAQSYAEVDRAVLAGIRDRIYPGAVVIIGRGDTVLYSRGYGRLTWAAGAAPASPQATLWDLASVTKVVGTTSAAARLVDRGALDLDAPVSRYLPRFRGGGRDRITVRMLLDHTSGLHHYREFYRRSRSRARTVALLLAERPVRTPGSEPRYSDVNMMLLGLVLEQVAGAPLDQVVQREVLRPLGMSRTMFRPDTAGWIRRIAPTSSWRGHPMGGIVNDQNAVAMGGVSGHAGLFATGGDLVRFAQTWLRRGRSPEGRRWLRPETVRRFLTPDTTAGSRLLGWDTPDTTHVSPSAFGRRFSQTVYGHTGWTGTQLWIDPSRDLFVIFLTNRSFQPGTGRSLEALRVVRADVADAAVGLPVVACRASAATTC